MPLLNLVKHASLACFVNVVKMLAGRLPHVAIVGAWGAVRLFFLCGICICIADPEVTRGLLSLHPLEFLAKANYVWNEMKHVPQYELAAAGCPAGEILCLACSLVL